jgi:hypothetical protein
MRLGQWSTFKSGLQAESKSCGVGRISPKPETCWQPVVARFATTAFRRTVAEIATVGPSAAESADRGKLVPHTTADGDAKFFLRAEASAVWLTQIELANLFKPTKQNSSLRFRNVSETGEIGKAATDKESLMVQTDGKRRVHGL